jgi:hypothetical protein
MVIARMAKSHIGTRSDAVPGTMRQAECSLVWFFLDKDSKEDKDGGRAIRCQENVNLIHEEEP